MKNFTAKFSIQDLNLTTYELNYLYRIQSIRSILPWFIIVFGLIGNLLILLIFLKKRNKKFNSNAFCFCSLAISDSLALIFMLLRSFVKLHVLSNLSISCKLIKFTYHVSLQISSWCLVLLTLDRLIAVFFIFNYKNWSKRYYIILIFIITVLTIILFNLHLIIFTESNVKKEDMFDLLTTTTRFYKSISSTKKPSFKPKYACSVDSIRYPFYSKYIYSKWDIYHAIVYGGLPFVIILSSNIAIISKLTFLKNKNFSRTKLSKTGSTKSLDKIDKSFKSKQITIMLLSVAFIFLAFTSPISIYMAIIYENLKNTKEVKKEYIKVILRYLGYFNNAINFYVYICLSSEFRKEFLSLFHSLTKYKPISSTISKCTMTTSLEMIDQTTKPLPPRTKPIIRQRLKINNKQQHKLNHELDEPFIDKDVEFENDPVEKFKYNTKNSKLIFYKKERFINTESTIV